MVRDKSNIWKKDIFIMDASYHSDLTGHCYKGGGATTIEINFDLYDKLCQQQEPINVADSEDKHELVLTLDSTIPWHLVHTTLEFFRALSSAIEDDKEIYDLIEKKFIIPHEYFDQTHFSDMIECSHEFFAEILKSIDVNKSGYRKKAGRPKAKNG
jgi:hypothetical protein